MQEPAQVHFLRGPMTWTLADGSKSSLFLSARGLFLPGRGDMAPDVDMDTKESPP